MRNAKQRATVRRQAHYNSTRETRSSVRSTKRAAAAALEIATLEAGGESDTIRASTIGSHGRRPVDALTRGTTNKAVAVAAARTAGAESGRQRYVKTRYTGRGAHTAHCSAAPQHTVDTHPTRSSDRTGTVTSTGTPSIVGLLPKSTDCRWAMGDG